MDPISPRRLFLKKDGKLLLIHGKGNTPSIVLAKAMARKFKSTLFNTLATIEYEDGQNWKKNQGIKDAKRDKDFFNIVIVSDGLSAEETRDTKMIAFHIQPLSKVLLTLDEAELGTLFTSEEDMEMACGKGCPLYGVQEDISPPRPFPKIKTEILSRTPRRPLKTIPHVKPETMSCPEIPLCGHHFKTDTGHDEMPKFALDDITVAGERVAVTPQHVKMMLQLHQEAYHLDPVAVGSFVSPPSPPLTRGCLTPSPLTPPALPALGLSPNHNEHLPSISKSPLRLHVSPTTSWCLSADDGNQESLSPTTTTSPRSTQQPPSNQGNFDKNNRMEKTSPHHHNGSMFHGSDHNSICKGRPKIPSAIAPEQVVQSVFDVVGATDPRGHSLSPVREHLPPISESPSKKLHVGLLPSSGEGRDRRAQRRGNDQGRKPRGVDDFFPEIDGNMPATSRLPRGKDQHPTSTRVKEDLDMEVPRQPMQRHPRPHRVQSRKYRRLHLVSHPKPKDPSEEASLGVWDAPPTKNPSASLEV